MKSFLILSILLGILSGCIKNNPDPSWIEINEFSVVSNSNLTEGELSMNGFTNGWVYVNDKFIGVFELPCKIPILETGTAVVRVYPTILNNGISATKKMYPFMVASETTVELVQNESAVVNPVTKYIDGTTFWIEDFEGGNIKLSAGNNSQTTLFVDNENDNRYGRVLVNSSALIWSVYTDETSPFSFPIGSEIFLEFECNDEAPLKTTFMYAKADGSIAQQYNITVTTAKEGWKKMYVDLTELVVNSGGYAFWVGFEVSLPDDKTEAKVLIDNIKVVYR